MLKHNQRTTQNRRRRVKIKGIATRTKKSLVKRIDQNKDNGMKKGLSNKTGESKTMEHS